MGMFIFIVSLGILFAASIVGYAVVRIESSNWPQDLPAMPWTLLLSTLILITSSVSVQQALNRARAGQLDGASQRMMVTLALGTVFLVLQVVAWWGWLSQIHDQWETSQAYRWALASFYVLTGVHALHVLGGLIPMAIAAKRIKRRSSQSNAPAPTVHPYAGIYYCAMYWHFLGGVWIVLYLTLLIGT